MVIVRDTREKAGSRAAGEYAVWSFLRQYLEGARKRFQAIVKAHGQAA